MFLPRCLGAEHTVLVAYIRDFKVTSGNHIVCKDNAKNRLSERNGNLFTFPSVRILSKPRAIQNERPETFIFIAEVPPVLFKPKTVIRPFIVFYIYCLQSFAFYKASFVRF